MNPRLRQIVLGVASRLTRSKSGLILFYHDVHDGRRYTTMSTSLATFKEHVAAIKSLGCRFVIGTPRQIGEVKICFDDGFCGLHDCQGFLENEGICPTVFIAPALVGQDGYLTWEKVEDLSQRGFIFQSHTWSHRPLTEVDVSELPHELADSKMELEKRIGKPVNGICFPCGMFSRKIIEASIAAGYANLYSSVPGDINCLQHLVPADEKAELYTRHLVQFFTKTELKYVLRGALKLFTNRYLNRHFMK